MKTVSSIAIAQSLCLIALPSLADHVPQACYDGRELMGKNNQQAIASLTDCIGDLHANGEISAIAYYNRSATRLAIYFEEVDQAIADAQLGLARDDIEMAIERDPDYGDAYCLRGQIDLELSFGFGGYEDLDQGIALGGRDEVCDVLN